MMVRGATSPPRWRAVLEPLPPPQEPQAPVELAQHPGRLWIGVVVGGGHRGAIGTGIADDDQVVLAPIASYQPAALPSRRSAQRAGQGDRRRPRGRRARGP